MADSFPQLSTGAVTQYPSSRTVNFDAEILKFVDGSEQRWAAGGSGQRRWELKLANVSEEELCAIEEFFVSQQGRFGNFSFTDPFDGTVYPDCSFEADSLHGQLFDEESAQSTLVIRTNL
jgi:phage-related protein